MGSIPSDEYFAARSVAFGCVVRDTRLLEFLVCGRLCVHFSTADAAIKRPFTHSWNSALSPTSVYTGLESVKGLRWVGGVGGDCVVPAALIMQALAHRRPPATSSGLAVPPCFQPDNTERG